jgi:four helix bundle protein
MGVLEVRTKGFALSVIRVVELLPRSIAGQVIGKQLIRSGTSVGAQYREGCRARSKVEFIAKIEGAIQELNETIYWLELLCDGAILPLHSLQSVLHDANEIIAMLTASSKTAKSQVNKTDKQ